MRDIDCYRAEVKRLAGDKAELLTRAEKAEAELAGVRADLLQALGWEEEADEFKGTPTIGLLTVLVDAHAKGMAAVEAEVGRLRTLCGEAASAWERVALWIDSREWHQDSRAVFDTLCEKMEALHSAGGEAWKEEA